MRVLHLVTRSQPRGAESAAVALAEVLGRRGYTTRLVALAPGEGACLEGVPVLGRRTLGARTLLHLRAEVKTADVVIAHGSRTLPAVVMASWGLGRRVIYQNIGDPLFWAGKGWRRRWVRFLLARMSMVAALTDQSADVLRTHFAVPTSRLRTIRNMRDGSRFHCPSAAERQAARKRLAVGPEDRVIAVIGALSPEKRVDLALEAGSRVNGAVVMVAGDGPQQAALERLAEGSPGKRIRFLGSLADVAPLLHASDALLMTSESEGVPGVLIEAGLCGVPAVSTAVGYVADVVIHGETGLLVSSDDPDDIRVALERVLAERERLGSAARKRCLERFELSTVVDDWAQVLGDPVSGLQPPSG